MIEKKRSKSKITNPKFNHAKDNLKVAVHWGKTQGQDICLQKAVYFMMNIEREFMFSRGNVTGKKCLFESNRKDISCPQWVFMDHNETRHCFYCEFKCQHSYLMKFRWTEQDLLLHLPQWTATLTESLKLKNRWNLFL